MSWPSDLNLSVGKTYESVTKGPGGKKPREAWEFLEAEFRNKLMDNHLAWVADCYFVLSQELQDATSTATTSVPAVASSGASSGSQSAVVTRQQARVVVLAALRPAAPAASGNQRPAVPVLRPLHLSDPTCSSHWTEILKHS